MNDAQVIINKAQDRFLEVCKGDKEKWIKESMYASQIIRNNSFLIKILGDNPQSIQDSIIQVASLGLTLNPAIKYAYLIPRSGKACLDPSYLGLIYLAQRDGCIKDVYADVVYQTD